MVLIRKQYFREHCEGVMHEYRKKHRVFAVWNGIGRRSFRRTVSTAPGLQPEGPTVEEETMSPGEPIVAAGEGVAAALVSGAGVGLSVGLDYRAFQDGAFDRHIIQSPLEEETLPVGKHTKQGVVADTHSFTSSPRSVAVSVQPVSPTSEHGNPGIRRDGQSLGSRQVRMDRNHMRKRASTCSLRSVQILTDNCTSPSVHDDDAEYCVFGASKAERPRHGWIPGTN